MIKENKAFVFDFDDTLAFTDAKVHVLSPTRLVRKGLTPQEFNSNKLREGESYDFSDFDKASLIGQPGGPLSGIVQLLDFFLQCVKFF